MKGLLLLWALLRVLGQLEYHTKDAGCIAVLVFYLGQEVLDEVVQKGLKQFVFRGWLIAGLNRFKHYYIISE